jgi:urea transport system permease protein
MVMLGAYTAYVTQTLFRDYLPNLFDASLLMAMPLAFAVSGVVGVVIERTVIRRLYGRPLETLLATWGISLILQQLVRSIFGASNRPVESVEWMSGAFQLGQLAITYNRLWILLFALAVVGVVALVLQSTSLGLQIRAVTQNRAMAEEVGIRTDRVDMVTFGLGSGIAGVAGVALSQIENVSPNLGQTYIIDSFMVIVFGGVGNLLGTLTGAMTLGVANKFLEPALGAVAAKVLILAFIVGFIQFRPQGLFPQRGRAAD